MNGIEHTLRLKGLLLYNFLFWVLLCVWDIIKTISFSINFDIIFEPSSIIRWPISSYLSYWILSHLIFNLYLNVRSHKKTTFLVYHFAGSVLFGIFQKFLSGTIGLLLERLFLETETKTWRELLFLADQTFFDIIASMFIYWMAIAILVGLDYYRKFNDQNTRQLELEGALRKAQLNNLKMQMNPHFIFNAFNTIGMMVRQGKNKDAIDMIGGLSDLLRLSLKKELNQFVSLADEVDLAKKYLGIESGRYQDQLDIIWDVEEKVLKQRVPNLFLQPIIENAFKHGISGTLGKATLKISIGVEHEHLRIEVFNTGSGWHMNWELHKGKGIGLANTIERMLKLYKESFKFVIKEHSNGVSVILKLPMA
ncbi:MAG: histidine kinase [Cytophagales bacterium]|nr:histidine kinase [Cytophagales bacterium]